MFKQAYQHLQSLRCFPLALIKDLNDEVYALQPQEQDDKHEYEDLDLRPKGTLAKHRSILMRRHSACMLEHDLSR